nr:nucleic acid-binding, OB-fold protein [Tanacetum cinerariifolium]
PGYATHPIDTSAATLANTWCHMDGTWVTRGMYEVQTNMSADMQVRGERWQCRWRLMKRYKVASQSEGVTWQAKSGLDLSLIAGIDEPKYLLDGIYRSTLELSWAMIWVCQSDCKEKSPEGNAIQANMNRNDIEYFSSILEIGYAYKVLDFNCEATSKWQQTLKNKTSLIFRRYVKFENIPVTYFPNHLFNFASYNQHDFKIPQLDSQDKIQHHVLIGSISTWQDLTTRFLAQLFLSRRTAKLQNDILMVQQHHVQIFYDCIDHTLKRTVDYAVEGRLRKVSAEKSWTTIEELARYEDEVWNDPIFPEEGILNDKNPNIEQLSGVMECQEVFDALVMNFILDQEEKVRQLEKYMSVIGSDFMQLSLQIVERLEKEIRIKENGIKKIEKITRYPNTKDLRPLNDHKISETLMKKVAFHTLTFIPAKSLYVRYFQMIFPSPPLVRKSTF